jgi:hypothetical protein
MAAVWALVFVRNLLRVLPSRIFVFYHLPFVRFQHPTLFALFARRKVREVRTLLETERSSVREHLKHAFLAHFRTWMLRTRMRLGVFFLYAGALCICHHAKAKHYVMSAGKGKSLFLETMGADTPRTRKCKPKLSLSLGGDEPPVRKGKPKLSLSLGGDEPPVRKGKPKLSLSLGGDEPPVRKGNPKLSLSLGGPEPEPRRRPLLGLGLGLQLSPNMEEEDEGEEVALARTSMDMDLVDSEGPANLARDAVKIRALGHGAAGIVYLGLYVPTLKLVAIKEVKVANDMQEQMVMNELHAEHENLIPISEEGEPLVLFHYHEAIGDIHPCEQIVSFYGSYAEREAFKVCTTTVSPPPCRSLHPPSLPLSLSPSLPLPLSLSHPLHPSPSLIPSTPLYPFPLLPSPFSLLPPSLPSKVCMVIELMDSGSLEELVAKGGEW